MIVFAHTKFGIVRIQGSGVKGGGGIRPRSERVFQIPVQTGLNSHFTKNERNRWRNFFLQLWKSDFDDFLLITENKCI